MIPADALGRIVIFNFGHAGDRTEFGHDAIHYDDGAAGRDHGRVGVKFSQHVNRRQLESSITSILRSKADDLLTRAINRTSTSIDGSGSTAFETSFKIEQHNPAYCIRQRHRNSV